MTKKHDEMTAVADMQARPQWGHDEICDEHDEICDEHDEICDEHDEICDEHDETGETESSG